MKKIAVMQPASSWYGGAQYVAVRTIKALSEHYSVDVFSYSQPDIEEIERFYDLALNQSNITFKSLGPWAILKHTSRAKFLKHYAAMSFIKKRVKEYDAVISSRNEMDLACQGLQYIHSPSIAAHHSGSIQFQKHIGKPSLLKQVYVQSVKSFFTNVTENNFLCNKTLTNSKWTADKIEKAYDLKSSVVYPPVPNDFPHVDWSEKSEAFACIGRIVPSKNILKIINILENVKKEGHNVSLYIIGKKGNKRYFDKVNNEVKSRSWIKTFYDASRSELVNQVSQCKYGIHGMNNEHFGISVAEMVSAGNIVFVPSGGGQVEIVNDERLVYENENDAVRKITNIINNNEKQHKIRNTLSQRSKKFSEKNFDKEIIKKVGNLL